MLAPWLLGFVLAFVALSRGLIGTDDDDDREDDNNYDNGNHNDIMD